MNANILLEPENKSIAGIIPSVSIFLPFEPKMNSSEDIAGSLKKACDRAARLVQEEYPEEESQLLLGKLRSMVDHLDFHTYKKSIALFVSPLLEKLLYLDISVEPKIIVNEAFEIRDLVYSKKKVHKYLVLVLGRHESRIFLGNTTSFVKILSKNLSNKEGKQDFFQAADQSLDIILDAYKLPLYVLGEAELLSEFSRLSKHSERVTEFIHGDYENAGSNQLKDVLEPYIENWQMVIQKDLMKQLVGADMRKQLIEGINAVWNASRRNSLKLLLIEKNYMFPKALLINSKNGDQEDLFVETTDAVDDAIEKVLTSGGDVEFVEEGMLEGYGKIVGIKN